MDFDIAGLLANPDFQYMLAGIGGAGGAAYNNPFAQAVGGITQQGIGAKNQMALLARLLGQGGKGEAFGTNDTEKKLQAFLAAHPETKMSTDGSKMTLSGPKTAFDSLGGSTPTATPPSGGQPGIINPSVGLPGDLSGLSLAGLKPEDINKAITLGLTGADLERKKVSDLYQNQYWQALVDARREATGAKNVLAPVEIPGVGQVSLDQFKAMPSDMKAYAYAMTQRRQNGQSTIPFEQFKRDTDPASMERLVNRAMVDPAFKDMWFKSKAAGATQINLPGDAAKQQQREDISNFNTLKDPKFKGFEPTKEQLQGIVISGSIPGDPAYDKAVANTKVTNAKALAKRTGAQVLEKEARLEDGGRTLVIPVVTKMGVKDELKIQIK